MDFICYPKCSTCSKARIYLENHQLHFSERNIKEQHPSEDEIRDWHSKSKLPLKRFFNTSGMLYRELHLKDKLKDMSEDEMYKLLATDGMLVKRPILIDGDTVLVGFKEKEWEENL